MTATYGELRTGTAGSPPRWQRNRRKPLLASERKTVMSSTHQGVSVPADTQTSTTPGTPDWLVPDQDSLEANAGARWPGIAATYQLLGEQGHRP